MAVGAAAGVGLSECDHGRIEIETGHVEAVPLGESQSQMSGAATHLEHPCVGWGDSGKVVGDGVPKPADEDSADDVVGDHVSHRRSTAHYVARARRAEVSPHRRNNGRGSENERDGSQPTPLRWGSHR